MTKKDYALLAKVIKGHTDDKNNGGRDIVMRGFALSLSVELMKNNPQFNVGLFLQATQPDKK